MKFRVVAVVVLVAAAVLLWVSLHRTGHGRSGLTFQQDQTPDDPGMVSGVPATHASSSRALQSHKESTRAEQTAPVIDEAALDKDELCQGEETLLRIRAHAQDGNGTDAFLTMSVTHPETGKTLRGALVPIQLDQIGGHELVVSVQSMQGTQTLALPVIVKECKAPNRVVVQVRRTLENLDLVALSATLDAAPDDDSSFEPVNYHWDFGDGTEQDTSTAEVEHSYENREQPSMESTFLVRLSVDDEHGAVARGSAAVAFANEEFVAMYLKNQVAISVGVVPGSAGQREQIRLHHSYPQSVHIERVRVRETVVDRADAPERETLTREYRPSEVLGTADLPPRTSVVLPDLTTLQPVQAGAVRYVELYGRSADGKRASAVFTLLAATKSEQNGG